MKQSLGDKTWGVRVRELTLHPCGRQGAGTEVPSLGARVGELTFRQTYSPNTKWLGQKVGVRPVDNRCGVSETREETHIKTTLYF